MGKNSFQCKGVQSSGKGTAIDGLYSQTPLSFKVSVMESTVSL